MKSFNWGSFFIGLGILLAGAAIIVFYRQISDNMASGVSSYDKTKLWGVIACILGLLVMLNIHSIILNALIKLVFKR